MAFRCVIVTPEQQLLDESLTQAILPAHDGQIGVLTDRAPLLVKLGTGPLEIDVAGGKRRTFFVDGGVAQMKDNRLTVVTDDAEPAESLNAETARAELAEATARQVSENFTAQQRESQMRRAKAKQHIAERK